MSCYTIVKPDKKDFEHYKNTDISSFEGILDSKWERIVMLCASIPKDITPEGQEPLEYVRDTFLNCWNTYINCSKQLYKAKVAKSIEEDNGCVYYNHFPYSDFEECKDDNKKWLSNVKNDLLGYASSSHSLSEENNNVDSVLREVSHKREIIDELINNYCFANLCLTYKDTIEYD
jgi:hypothetical protein